MELLLLLVVLHYLVKYLPERPDPPPLSRWDLLMIQVRERREREERERAQREADASAQPALPPPGDHF